MNYYEALGVHRTAPYDEIRRVYLDKADRLDRERFAGAPDGVLAAVERAGAVMAEAWRTLSDSDLRFDYDGELDRRRDEEARRQRARRSRLRRAKAEHVWEMEQELGMPLTPAFGLEAPRPDWDFPAHTRPTRGEEPPHDPAEAPPDRGDGGLTGAHSLPSRRWGVSPLYDPIAPVEALADWLGSHESVPRIVTVPSLIGLRASEVIYAVAAIDVQVQYVRLTPNPAPVDGTVVDQDPLPGAIARRHSVVTVRVAHPPTGTAGHPR